MNENQSENVEDKRVISYNINAEQVNISNDEGMINANLINDMCFDGGVVTFTQDITYTNNFLGRKEDIKNIIKIIEKKDRILISGIGGIGKTTISKRIYDDYLKKNRKNRMRKLGYFNYELSLDETICNALKYNKTGDKNIDIPKAWNILEDIANNYEALFIIDNIPTNAYEEIEKLNVLAGKIVITSRQCSYENYEAVEIKELKLEQCMELFILNSRLPKEKIDNKCLEYIIDELVARHTLTIELLAKITRKKNWTLEELKFELERIKFKIEYKDKGELKSILSEYKKLYPISGLEKNEQNILEGFSLLREAKLNIDTCLQYLSKDANNCDRDDFYGLYEKGWLQKDESVYSIHPVFAEFILEIKKPDILKHRNLYELLDNISSYDKENQLLEIQKHLTSLISFAKYIFLDNDLQLYKIEKTVLNIARISYDYADYNNTIFILQRIGKKHIENYIKANLLLSDVYTLKSLFKEAGKSLKKIKQLIEELNDGNPLYIDYMINYAVYLEKKSKNDKERFEAINVLENIVDREMEEKQKGCIYNCLGGFYTNLERNSENLKIAMEYHLKAKKIREKYAESDTMDIARTYNNIANVYFYLADINKDEKESNLEKAEYYYKLSLKMRQKAYRDEKHPDIARILVNLGNVYVKQNRLDKALEKMEEGLQIRLYFLGEISKEVGITYSNLMNVYAGLNNKDKAEFCDRKTREIYEKLYTKDSDEYKKISEKHQELLQKWI